MKTKSTFFNQLFLIVAILFTFSLSAWGEEVTATLSFANKAQRTSYNKDQQVWEQNGIILTNNQSKSTSAVADYANPARFYKSSEIIIEAPGNITKIVFDCNSNDYATALKNSIIGNSATASSDKVTVALDGSSDHYTISSLSGGQVRMDALTVTYDNGEEPETPTETLNTPANITTTEAKSQTINVTWDAVTETAEGTTDISGVTYTLYDNNNTIGRTTETSFKITGLTPNTTYNFAIEASKNGFITSEKQTFTATTKTNTVANIAEFIAREDENELTITGEVTIIAQSSEQSHTWIQDETGAIMMMSYNVIKEYSEGDKITRLKGKYDSYNQATRLTPTELPEAIQGSVPNANLISIADASIYVHKKVTLSNLKCTKITQESGKADVLTLSDGTDTIETYGNYFEFNFASVVEQSKFDVTAIVGKYYSTIQLYIISIDNVVLPKMYTINFHTGENSFESYNVVENTTFKNHPNNPTSCDNEYSDFVGWTTSTTTNGTEQPELFDFTTPITSNLNLYPVFAQTGSTGGGEPAWTLVTDASTLAVGDQVVIAAKEYNYAMSTTQNNNNRGQAAITKNGDVITLTSAVQEFTLESGTVDGTFAFAIGTGYLYAASSSANHLKTQQTNNANGSWMITIANDGTATIVAQGNNTRNTMQYNQSSSLFACYGSATQKALALYKLTKTTTEKATAWTICYVPTTDIAIESGDEKEVNKTTKYNTLIIKSNGDQAGQINVTNGSISANKVILEKTIDHTRWFFFSLPFDCDLNNVVATDADDNVLTYVYDAEHGDYVINYYDQTRNATTNKAWVELIDTSYTLKANQGYIIGHFGTGDVTVKFPSKDAVTISVPATKTLNYTDSWTAGDVENSTNGWNLIGLPYYQSVDGSLNPTMVSIPREDGTYNQVDYTSANIQPFTSFFVQTTEAPTFTIAAHQNAAPMLRAKGEASKAVISLVDANGVDDKTTIINNPNNTNDYEIGHDLAKWIGYAARPQIYSIQGDDILAFNSLAIDNSTIIPLGVYAHADGEYTFRLSEKSVDDLEGWELYDNETGKTTRLANEALTLYLEQGTHEGRFEIRLQQRITTDCDNAMGDMTTWTANGTLNINNLPADAVVYIYDAVGRMIYAANNNSTAFNYTFAARGIYNIVVRSADNTVSFKTNY